MLIGYARVSTEDQSLDLQIDALACAGCEQIFQDHGVSGAAAERPQLEAALATIQGGDTLVVWRLDRLVRSIYELSDVMRALKKRNVAFRSLTEGLDTNSVLGEITCHIAGAFAHLERSLIIERTRAGMAAAKARGVKFGRAPALTGEELREAVFLIDRGLSVPKTAAQLGVARSTLYRHLAEIRRLERDTAA